MSLTIRTKSVSECRVYRPVALPIGIVALLNATLSSMNDLARRAGGEAAPDIEIMVGHRVSDSSGLPRGIFAGSACYGFFDAQLVFALRMCSCAPLLHILSAITPPFSFDGLC